MGGGGRLSPPTEAADQSEQQTTDLVDEFDGGAKLDVSEQPEPSTRFQVRLQLPCGAARDGKESQVIATVVAAVSFGDIRRDRGRSAAQLVGERESLLRRKPRGDAVALDDQVHSALPSSQVAEARERHGRLEGSRVDNVGSVIP